MHRLIDWGKEIGAGIVAYIVMPLIIILAIMLYSVFGKKMEM